MALSDTWLRTHVGKAIDKPMEKTDRDGLSVRVSAKGKIVFQMRFWHGGKQCRLDIGSYPALSLKQARDELVKFKADVEKGHDPRVSKKLGKQSNVEAVTVSQLFYRWYEAYCIANKKGHFEIKRSFEIHLLPLLGAFPVDKTTTVMWCDLLDSKLKHSVSITERLLINAKQMMNWAVRRQLIAVNPLQNITSKADFNITKNTSSRFLTPEEIKMLFHVLDNSRTAHKNRLFLKLCLIYGCRNGELRLAQRADFDFDNAVWTVPATNHKGGKKSGKPLKRPILPETQAMFLELFALSGCEYLLTNGGGNQPMTGSASVALPYNLMQWLRSHAGYEMAHWSIHDLRRTARTNFSTLAQPHVCEIMLGHTFKGEWMTYDRYDYLEEQKAAYQAWIARLSELVEHTVNGIF